MMIGFILFSLSIAVFTEYTPQQWKQIINNLKEEEE